MTTAGVVLNPTLQWNVTNSATKVTATAAAIASTISLAVSWTPAETTRIGQIAAFIGGTPAAVQKTSVFTIAFLVGLGSPTPTPVTLPAAGVATIYTNSWTPPELTTLQTVKNKYVLNDVDAQRFSVGLMDFLLALGGH